MTTSLGSQPPRSLRFRWYALVVLCLGQLIIGVDSSALNVALPIIERDLGHLNAHDRHQLVAGNVTRLYNLPALPG